MATIKPAFGTPEIITSGDIINFEDIAGRPCRIQFWVENGSSQKLFKEFCVLFTGDPGGNEITAMAKVNEDNGSFDLTQHWQSVPVKVQFDITEDVYFCILPPLPVIPPGTLPPCPPIPKVH